MTFRGLPEPKMTAAATQDIFAVQVLLSIAAEWSWFEKNQQHSKQTQKYD
jgi:hypothetical protein